MTDSNPALDALAASGIPFEVGERIEAHSLHEAAAMRGIEPGDIVKTMVVRRAADDYVLVLVPGDRQIAWPRLRGLLGVNRLSMPDASTARDVTGYERGTITPFGTKAPLPVVADTRVQGRRVFLGAGERGLTVAVQGDDVIALFGALVADVTDPL